MPIDKERKLHRGRRGTVLWLKPEHVTEIDELAHAKGVSRSACIINLIIDSLARKDIPHQILAQNIWRDAISRAPGTRNDLKRIISGP